MREPGSGEPQGIDAEFKFQESVPEKIEMLKRLVERNRKRAVFPVDVMASTREKFDEVVTQIVEALSPTQVRESQAFGTPQYDEVIEILNTADGNVLLLDTQTSSQIPGQSWIHSHDQGLSSENQKIKEAVENHPNTKVILVRFCDSSQEDQVRNTVALDDFRVSLIKAS